MPIFADDLALATQQIERRFILRFVEFVRIFDAQIRFGLHQIQCRVGNVNRAVERLHTALVGLAVRQYGFFKHDFP